MSALSEEELDDAADDLLGAADYLKTALDDGDEIYESKWLGATMQAHGLMRQAAAEIRRLRASLAERDALLAKALDLVRKAYNEAFIEGTKEHTHFSGGKSWENSRAASLAAELKEKQG